MPASREVRAIVGFVVASGLPHRVTDLSGPGHSAGSYHYSPGTDGLGLAVDFGGAIPGVTPVTTKQMTALYWLFRTVAGDLAELIYNAPGTEMAVKDGRLRVGATFYGPVTWGNHRNHLHVAVKRGTFLIPRAPAPVVSGSGPPTVTATPYPEGETMLTRLDVDIPALDGQGRGWFEIAVPVDRVVSVGVNGPYPPVDGYWEMPIVAWQGRGEKTIVSLTEGRPNAPTLARVWHL